MTPTILEVKVKPDARHSQLVKIDPG